MSRNLERNFPPPSFYIKEVADAVLLDGGIAEKVFLGSFGTLHLLRQSYNPEFRHCDRAPSIEA